LGECSLGSIDVLLVCTGNICRSPMAEALLRDRLARRGVPSHVHSCGLLDEGQPASAHGVDVLRERQLDLSGHRSRTMTRELVTGADLLLGMARLHVREAVVLAPEVWPRSFTLKELVRRGEDVGARPPGQSVEEWLQKAHAGRSHADLLGDATEDDVFDPVGSSRAVYERTASELADLTDRLVALLFGSEPTP
jgi:protein-tyrosine phosphatase